MTKGRLIAAAAVACAVWAGVAAVWLLDSDGGDASVPDSLEESSYKRVGNRLVEIELRAPALGEDSTGVRVLLPRGYTKSKQRYPVLYLLHGRRNDFRSWTEVGGVAGLTKRLPLIVVMPDGGENGFYSDWYNAGRGGPPMWETYHVSQLIPYIERRFRARSGKDSRAIAGISMGGFGALSYAARHPELFSTAASFSGALDTNYEPFTGAFESAARTDDDEPAVWGSRKEHEEIWRAHNPADLAANLASVQVLLYTGNGQPGGAYGTAASGGVDPTEAAVHEMTLSMSSKLTQAGIVHLLDDYGPGAHTYDYGRRDLAAALPLIVREFRSPKPKKKPQKK